MDADFGNVCHQVQEIVCSDLIWETMDNVIKEKRKATMDSEKDALAASYTSSSSPSKVVTTSTPSAQASNQSISVSFASKDATTQAHPMTAPSESADALAQESSQGKRPSSVSQSKSSLRALSAVGTSAGQNQTGLSVGSHATSGAEPSSPLAGPRKSEITLSRGSFRRTLAPLSAPAASSDIQGMNTEDGGHGTFRRRAGTGMSSKRPVSAASSNYSSADVMEMDDFNANVRRKSDDSSFLSIRTWAGTNAAGTSNYTPEQLEERRLRKEAKLKKKREKEEEKEKEIAVGTKIGEGHVNYVQMYDMLTGIRVAVSRCVAKPHRDLVPSDFTARHKLTFDILGNELTPSSRYDFKFKDYAPWVFRYIREHFKIEAADYLVRTVFFG